MNYTELLRQCVAYFSFAIASIFVLSLVGFLLRRQLRVLLDRWRALGRLGQCVTLVFVSGFVLYGGSKNMAQQRQHQDSDSQHEPLFSQESLESLFRSLERSESESEPSSPLHLYTANPTFNSQLSTISRWAARGAWVDWQRIEFPDGFAFPIGTNQITEVTLMSYGELRTSLNQPTNQQTNQPTTNRALVSLPRPVSLEPGESSIHYGLTPSNSFLIAWENVCVERSATNRVDASIELFRNGDTLVTVQPINQSTNSPTHQPTTIFTPVALPEGWVGEGQDAAWASTAFPSNATDIAAMGYENWLADYVGVNEANGRYQVKISVMTLPDGPCYLVCGPYKTVITAPGVYCFPLEVFETYHVRTYPVAVPLSFEYDDGYRGDETNAHAACLSAALPPPTGGQADNDYYLCEMPRIVITPNYIPYDQAEGATVSIWANVKSSVRGFFTSLSGLSRVVLTGGGSRAEIIQAQVGDSVRYNLEKLGHHCDAEITIGPRSNDHEEPRCCDACCGDYCSCDGTCCACRCNCWGYMPETSGTNGTTTVTQP